MQTDFSTKLLCGLDSKDSIKEGISLVGKDQSSSLGSLNECQPKKGREERVSQTADSGAHVHLTEARGSPSNQGNRKTTCWPGDSSRHADSFLPSEKKDLYGNVLKITPRCDRLPCVPPSALSYQGWRQPGTLVK